MLFETLLRDSFFQSANLPNWGVKLKIHPMDYPFLLPHLFYSDRLSKNEELEMFKGCIQELASLYMKRWIMENTDKKMSENLDYLFTFSSNFDVLKHFDEISGGKDWTDIIIPVSNAKWQIKRFGQGLGLKAMANNGRNEVHEAGTALVRKLSDERQGVSEFLYSVECVMALSKKHAKENSVDIDFELLYTELLRACPYVKWASFTEFRDKLYADYIFVKKPQNIGSCHGASIYARLIHHGDSSTQETSQWRRGNISPNNANGTVYNFMYGNDLCLSISVQGTLPKNNFLNQIHPSFCVAEEQNRIYSVGVMIYTQLCSLATHQRHSNNEK